MDDLKDFFSSNRKIIPYLCTALTFVGLGIFTSMPIILATAVSVIVFFGSKYMVQHSAGLLELPDDLVQAIEAGEETTIVIKRLTNQVKPLQPKQKLEGIVSTANQIFDYLRKKPKDAKIIREFLDSYLHKTKAVLEKYVELSEQNIDNQEIKDILLDLENALDSIDSLFKKQQVKLLKDGAIDLSVEIEVLKIRDEME